MTPRSMEAFEQQDDEEMKTKKKKKDNKERKRKDQFRALSCNIIISGFQSKCNSFTYNLLQMSITK